MIINSVRIIIISYLKLYSCVQTKDYGQIRIVTWNIVFKLSILDRMAWNSTTMFKLFILNRNT